MATRVITVRRHIAAPASTIFDLLATPSRHPELDGLDSVQELRQGPPRLYLGAKFSMGMHRGASYTTTNVVSAFEENRVIAWHHWAHFIWRYDLREEDGGTLVTESFDYTKPWGIFLGLTKWPAQNVLGMEKTLARIEAIVTAPPAS